MKRIFITIALATIAIMNTTAQTINGKVVDKNNSPVDFATIVIQSMDSIFVGSTMTDEEGKFSINVDLIEFRLFIQHLMFEQTVMELSKKEIGTTILKEKDNLLSEVEVKGERSVVKLVDGKLTYDIDRLLEDKSASNVYEALLYLPGMSEDRDGGLSLAGTNGLTIMINGKPSTMTTEQLEILLKNTPHSRVESAEVMYNTPPQYHVRGASINLILKGIESSEETLQGQVNARYNQKHYAGHNTGTSILYGTSKYSIDALYSLDDKHKRQNMGLYSHHSLDGKIYDIDMINNGTVKDLTHNVRIGGEYKITDKDKLNLEYTTQLTPKYNASEAADATFANSVNYKKIKSPIQMHNVGLNYDSRFGTTIGVNYTTYKNHSYQDFDAKGSNEITKFISHSKQDIDRVKTYIDQSHNLGKDWDIQYGVNFALASDYSSQIYETILGEGKEDINTSSRLKEYTYSAYLGARKTFTQKVTAAINVEVEKYQNNKVSEWSLYPSFSLSYVMSPSHILQFGISSDKSYPSFWHMGNSIGYPNAYAEIHGNPDLKPSKEYASQLTYIVNRKYSITTYANYEDGYFVQLPYQAPDRLKLIYKTTNFDYQARVGFAINIPFVIEKILSSQLLLNGFYTKEKSSHFHDMSFVNDKIVGYVKLDNTINISSKPNIKLELAGAYITKSIQGYSTIDPLWKIDAGMKWTFAKDKLELRVRADDVLKKWKPRMGMRYASQNLRLNADQDSRNISLTLSYKFGGYKEKQNKEVDTSRFGL